MIDPTEIPHAKTVPVRNWSVGRIVAAVFAALWLAVLLIGLSVTGEALHARLRLYFLAPVIGFTCSCALVAFAKSLSSGARVISTAISLVALLIVFGAFGGGI